MENKQPVYKVLTNAIVAYQNCEKAGNGNWLSKWEDQIEYIVREYLPSGSGIDSGCEIPIAHCNADKIIITSAYHRMDEHGLYQEWIDFTVTVTPSLLFDFDLKITGRFGKHHDIKDYLQDLFSSALEAQINRGEGLS